MSEIIRILSNSAWLAAQRLANALIHFLFFILLFHSFSKEAMGILELGRNCLEIGAGIVVPGLAILILREESRDPHWWRQHAAKVQTILRALSGVVAFVFFILANLFNPSAEKGVVTGLFCISIFFQSSCTAFESFFIARDRVKWSILVNMICSIGMIALALLTLSIVSRPLMGIAFLMLLRWIANHLIYHDKIQRMHQQQSHGESINPYSVTQLFQDSLPLTLGSVFYILYARLDTLMLEWIGGGEASIALYSGAYRIVGMLSLVFLAGYQALVPTISRHVSVSYRNAFWLVLAIGTGFGLMGLGFSIALQYGGNNLIQWLYPEEYAQSVEGLYILAWTLPVIFLGNAFGYFLVNEANRGTKLYMIISLLGLVVNFVGNGLLIPTYDFIGAAWMTLLTDGITTLMMILSVVCIAIFCQPPRK